MKKILVIGVGWLGKQIVDKLFNEGYHVGVCSRSKEKLEGITKASERIVVSYENGECHFSGDISPYTHVLICLPPFEKYPEVINSIIKQLSDQTQLIFMSSIGVYNFQEGIIYESSPIQENHLVAEAEQVVLTKQYQVILRLGGLIGPKRHPITHLIKKDKIEFGNNVVNLIHSFDICSAIIVLLKQEKKASLYNLVYPKHPTRASYYQNAAKTLRNYYLKSDDTNSFSKQVDGSKIVKELGFQYEEGIENWHSFDLNG